MRILRSIRHKSCADGTRMKEFLLSDPVTEDFFLFLKNFGHVEILPNVGEGFYKFEKKDCFSIKGLVGDTTLEVRFIPEVMDITVKFLYALFHFYGDGKPDIKTLKQREAGMEKRVNESLYGK
ncbi:MAG: hypothetical protein GX097_02735 [Methanomicrobiales archaeon]|nr:hypothetical protein [Methanomicrobiales archaeon]